MCLLLSHADTRIALSLFLKKAVSLKTSEKHNKCYKNISDCRHSNSLPWLQRWVEILFLYCLCCVHTVASWHGKQRFWLLMRYSAVTQSPSLDWGYVVLNSSKSHNTLNHEKLTAEHTKSKLLKTKAGMVGAWPDAEPLSTFTHSILTVLLQCTWQVQVWCFTKGTRTVPRKVC